MFFDLNTMDAAAQSKALDNAIQFVQQQATASDRIAVMTYTSRLNVLTDFTGDRDTIVATLRTITPVTGAVAGNPGAQLQGIQAAISVLAPVPDKKAMIYFPSGVPKNGADDQDQLNATVNAAVRANVSIYSVDSRGLVPARQ